MSPHNRNRRFIHQIWEVDQVWVLPGGRAGAAKSRFGVLPVSLLYKRIYRSVFGIPYTNCGRFCFFPLLCMEIIIIMTPVMPASSQFGLVISQFRMRVDRGEAFTVGHHGSAGDSPLALAGRPTETVAGTPLLQYTRGSLPAVSAIRFGDQR